jgi:phenylacetate-CoA ligase
MTGGFAPRSAMPGIAWPGLPHPAGQAMLAAQFQLDLSQWWSAEQVVERQFAQLNRLARHAIATVPWFRRFAASGKIDAAAPVSPASLAHWPVQRKADIQRDSASFLAESLPAGHGDLQWITTSGSTGQPLRAANTDVARFFQHALLVRSQEWYGLDYRAKFATIRALVASGRSADWGPPANAMFQTGPSCIINSVEDHRTQLEWLCSEAPGILLAHNTNLNALLKKSAHHGIMPRSIRTVLGFGDMKHSDTAALARSLWNAQYFDTYSCSEIGPVALQCPDHDSLHVQSEHVYLEIVRGDGSPCDPGETGRVLVTDLHNFGMPFIRYEVGDYARLGPACACGRGLPVLEQIVGRAGQVAVDPTGRTFFPRLNHEFWAGVAPILQWQMIQRAADELEVLYVADDDLDAEQTAKLLAHIREEMRYAYRIGFSRVAAIKQSPGGKFDDFVGLTTVDR